MTTFFSFPHTSHLLWLGKQKPRAEKILTDSERTEMLLDELTIEEKIDGANLGFSLELDGKINIQNRGKYLSHPYIGQFKKLPDWLSAHEGLLFDALDENLIVFGEWCAARHSILYTDLPDWWVLFDVYDKRDGRFFSAERRNKWADKANVATVHQVAKGYFDTNMLLDLLVKPSRYHKGNMEGIVLRYDNESWLVNRAKLVRSEFTQAIGEHWSRKAIEWNKLQAM